MNEQLQLAYAINQAALRFNSQADALLREQYDISYRQYLTLIGIEYLQPCNQRQLAEFAQVTSAGMLHILTGLEAKAWIKKRFQPHNKRTVSITMTELGARTFASMHKKLGERLVELIDLSQSDRAQLLTMLQRIMPHE